MASIQIRTNNVLCDLSQVPIPPDDADPAQIAKPPPWSMGEITRFILFIGPSSGGFDGARYYFGRHSRPQSTWAACVLIILLIALVFVIGMTLGGQYWCAFWRR